MAIHKWIYEIGQIIRRVDQVTKGNEDDEALAQIVFVKTAAHVDKYLKAKRGRRRFDPGWRERTIGRFAAIVAMTVKALREQEDAHPQVKPRAKSAQPGKAKTKTRAAAKSRPKAKAETKAKTKARPKVKGRSVAKRKK